MIMLIIGLVVGYIVGSVSVHNKFYNLYRQGKIDIVVEDDE